MTKQVDIKELIPFMKKGWVAMDKNGKWCWFDKKPFKDDLDDNIWICHKGWLVSDLSKVFNIAPAKDWTKSLMKVGGVRLWL